MAVQKPSPPWELFNLLRYQTTRTTAETMDISTGASSECRTISDESIQPVDIDVLRYQSRLWRFTKIRFTVVILPVTLMENEGIGDIGRPEIVATKVAKTPQRLRRRLHPRRCSRGTSDTSDQ